MTKTEKLLDQLNELYKEGERRGLIDKHLDKEQLTAAETRRYLTYYKKVRAKLRKLYCETYDKYIYERYLVVHDLVTYLEAILKYKELGVGLYTPVIKLD